MNGINNPRVSNHDRCFASISRRDATALVLGSLPGRRSLELQQYYAHPHNAFWKLIAAIFTADAALPYAQRTRILTRHRIALWDVLAAAQRPGSLDSSIVPSSAQVNDFQAFLHAHPQIQNVYFNGRKAEQLYRRFALPKGATEFSHIQYECLPSTSPAHAGMSFAKKLERWSRIKERQK